MECERTGCEKTVSGRSDKRYCSASCKEIASRKRNYRKVKPRAPRREIGERPLTSKEQKTLASVRRVLGEARTIYDSMFGAESSSSKDPERPIASLENV